MEPDAITTLQTLVGWLPKMAQIPVLIFAFIVFGSSQLVALLKQMIPVPTVKDSWPKKALNALVHALDVAALNSTPFWAAMKQLTGLVAQAKKAAVPPPVPPAAIITLAFSLLLNACASNQALQAETDASNAIYDALAPVGMAIAKQMQADVDAVKGAATNREDGLSALDKVVGKWAPILTAYSAAQTAQNAANATIKAGGDLTQDAKVLFCAYTSLASAGAVAGVPIPEPPAALKAFAGDCA